MKALNTMYYSKEVALEIEILTEEITNLELEINLMESALKDKKKALEYLNKELYKIRTSEY